MASFHIVHASAAGHFPGEAAALYAVGLRELGHEVRCEADALPDTDAAFRLVVCPLDYRAYFLLDKLAVNPLENHRLAPASAKRALWQPPVVMAAEIPVWSRTLLLWPGIPQGGAAELGVRLARHAGGVLGGCPGDAEWWQSKGVPALPLPFPYPLIETSSIPALESRGVDVVFFGADSRRRSEFFSSASGEFDAMKHVLRLVRAEERAGSLTPGVCLGAGREALLSNAKILLSVRAHASHGFSWHRAALAAAHGCALLADSPPEADHAGDAPPGLFAPVGQMSAMCQELLQQPDELNRLAAASRQWFRARCDHRTQWLRLEDRLRDILPASRRPRRGVWFAALRRLASLPLKREAMHLAVKRGGRRQGRRFRVGQSPCVFTIKPVVTWPTGGPASMGIRFRGGQGLPSRAQVETRAVIAGRERTELLDLPVTNGRMRFFLPEGAVLLSCTMTIELPPGKTFSMPEAWWRAGVQGGGPGVFFQHEDLPGVVADGGRCGGVTPPPAAWRVPSVEDCTIKRNFTPPLQGRAPDVSVVIPLHNYAQFISDTLASVGEAAARLGEGRLAEVIVIDDASTDDGAKRVLDAMTCPTPVTLVMCASNRGLADARNLGAHVAAAPLVCYLDADNLLLPHGLKLLVDGITLSKAPAAYGILASFHDTQTTHKPDSLVSQYAWDPRWLMRGNTIDAMAVFEKSTLVQLGGYDPGLAGHGAPGWEDYDLWLRFAAHGLEPCFVPSLVGRYRKHGQSMMNRHTTHHETLLPLLHSRYGWSAPPPQASDRRP